MHEPSGSNRPGELALSLSLINIHKHNWHLYLGSRQFYPIESILSNHVIWLNAEKLFKSKLLLSFLAIVLVIKLIKIKIFWILPLIVGVGAAKKLLLKFILFLFPALSHLFKLCSYYHKNYQDTKYHHHHHQINHLHTVCRHFHYWNRG